MHGEHDEGSVAVRSRLERWARAVGLWGIAEPRLELALTAATVVLLAGSRFLLLANGPWEWDEANFARGILSFNLEAHFPHPPGFPLWIFAGWLLTPVAGEPLVALQLWSALASVVVVWPLARLGRRLAPAAVATAAALLVLLTPGVWLHSVRAFSSTAAATLALAAAAMLVGPATRRRMTLFTGLVCLAALTRPQLLPSLAVLWLAGAWRCRRWRDLVPGVAAAVGLVAVAFAAMAWATGGWASLVAAFTTHGNRHVSRLVGNPGGVLDLGLVKGWGGPGATALALAVIGLGLGVWARRESRRAALVWALTLAVLAATVIGLHNRTYARYAVPLVMAPAPLIAAGAALLPPAWAVAGLLTAATVVGCQAWPLVVEQHASRLPAWEALVFAHDLARRQGMTVVIEPSIYPLASYQWHRSPRLDGVPAPAWVLSPRGPRPWEGVEGPYVVVTDHPDLYPDPLVRGEVGWSAVSAELEPLTQGRMLEAAVISRPPLPVGQWWAEERSPEGETFLWAGSDAALDLPPLPEGTSLHLDLRPAAGDEELWITVNGRRAVRLEGRAPRQGVVVEAAWLTSTGSNRIELSRPPLAVVEGGDPRPLSVQLFDLDPRGPWLPWRGTVATADGRAAIAAELEGAYDPEPFSDGPGVWTRPSARLSVPAGEGLLELELRAPRELPPDTVVSVVGGASVGPVRPEAWPTTVVVPIAAEALESWRVSVELSSTGLCPRELGLSDDDRQLGVVLGAVAYRPWGVAEGQVWW